jgi:hypothetical protein
VIFQDNKFLVSGSLRSLYDNIVVSPDEEVAQRSNFSLFFFHIFFLQCERENEFWDLSHGDQEPLKLLHEVEKVYDIFLI